MVDLLSSNMRLTKDDDALIANMRWANLPFMLKISFPFRGNCLALNRLAENARYWQWNGNRFPRKRRCQQLIDFIRLRSYRWR